VVVDRAMPDMSGDQVASAIKSVDSTMPVVMLTGFGAMMEATGEKPPSVDLVVGKPITMEDLRAAVARVVAPTSAGL
jgi:FixJ family two-component response regulator